MSIFGSIVSAIFGTAKAAGAAVSEAASAATTAVTGGAAKAQPMTREQVEASIQKVADTTGRKDYNWKQSIVDLMKLLNLDSSLTARKQLAQELGLYRGARWLGGDERLAAQASDGQNDGEWRHGARQLEIDSR